jgi:hypothetical protein
MVNDLGARRALFSSERKMPTGAARAFNAAGGASGSA